MPSNIRLVIAFGIVCVGALVATLLTMPAIAGTNSWTAIGPSDVDNYYGGPFAVDPSSPSTIYLVVNSSIVMKTTDGGGHWTNMAAFDVDPINSLVVDPASPATIYAAGGSPWDYGDFPFYKSIDGGAHWTAVADQIYATSVVAIAPSLTSTLYAGQGGTVSKSIDGGMSWATFSSGLTGYYVSALAVDPTNADTAYVAQQTPAPHDGGTIFKTTNFAGQLWRQVPISVPVGAVITSIAIDPATPSIIYAAYAYGNPRNGGVFKSVDSGETWSPAQSGLSDTNGVAALAIDPSAPAGIYAATTQGVFRSLDAAASWTPINAGLTGLNVWAISVDRTGTILRTLSSAGFFEYQVSGASPPPAVLEYQDTKDFPGSPGGHFFYTDNADEQAIVDSGIAGHFVRTGKAFNAGGTKQVCRFYGSIVPGPNSHFYTISDEECDLLKSLQRVPTPSDVPQWNYEGLGFAEEPSQTGAADLGCMPGTVPVFRGYNNAYPAAGPKNPWDSAHRYSTTQADIQQMVTQFGWRDEGIAFCSPP